MTLQMTQCFRSVEHYKFHNPDLDTSNVTGKRGNRMCDTPLEMKSFDDKFWRKIFKDLNQFTGG